MKYTYFKTKIATDWTENKPTILERFIRCILFFIPEANPNYKNKMHLVSTWLIEFVDQKPWREIGLDDEKNPVVAGPTSRDYGFWCDTNMEYNDFKGESIAREDFEGYWKEYFKTHEHLKEFES